MPVPHKQNKRVKLLVRKCHYCGTLETDKIYHWDHFVPRARGGSDNTENLVLACPSCNQIKGRRMFYEARLSLLLKRLGWPNFTRQQLIWLKMKGFDVRAAEQGKLYFEETIYD
jgi:5-methylcytosine-specific restriction endonuclease McrA